MSVDLGIFHPRPDRAECGTHKHLTKYTNADLPEGTLDNNDWQKRFITTYEKWLGTHAEPWVVGENENLAALQAIWNVVYPHIDHVIDADGPVYYIANQRASEWRSSFGSAAVAMLKSSFDSENFSREDKITTADHLLRNNKFMYVDTTGASQTEYRGLFRSPWILHLFAGHYDSISGAIRVPGIEPLYSQDQQSLMSSLESELKTLDGDSQGALKIAIKLDTMQMYPKGALALCAVAVERALGIFAMPGNDSSSATFNRRWNKQVRKYREIIDRKLQPGSMEDIVLRAYPLMKASTIFSPSIVVIGGLDDDDVEDIEMFVDV
ncbi:hypothetical protein BC826DRAFT_1192694 [Russula brevipes]|nr:hypothetical protein BC826DRAFT_1192694 [Russula brevipes]